jgi:hypothetical protein
MGGVIMKKLISALCAAGLYFGLVTINQAEQLAYTGFREFIPGSCYLDGRISPPKKSLDNLDGFEVPLVAKWIPLQLEGTIQYRGDAKFVVHNFNIGDGKLINAYIVDVGLNRDDPRLSEKERHNRFIYKCEDGFGSCTATLATVKEAITTQIARDYEIRPDDVRYGKDASATFLGVYIKGGKPVGIGTGDKKGQIYLHTEVCGTYEYEITMAESNTIY